MIPHACRCLFCVLLAAALVASPGSAIERPADPGLKSVVLTDLHPSASFLVARETIASKPQILYVSVPKVVNPAHSSLEILAYLVRVEHGGKAAGEPKILIGRFGLFPPDHPAGFQLSASDAFGQLQATGSTSATEVRVVFEMRRLHESESAASVELTVSPPAWRQSQK